MITIDKVVGNIKKDQKLREKYDDLCSRKLCETVKITRLESSRVRMRKVSDKGTDIALILPQGAQLRDGDIIMLDPEKLIIIEIEPENVAMVEIEKTIEEDHITEVLVTVGHTIGNLHRPIKLEGNKIYFPIQADAELEMFSKLFAHIRDHLKIEKTKMVFEPEEGTELHEH